MWQNGNWNLQNLLGEQFHSCSHFYKLYCILQTDTKSGASREEGVDATWQRSSWVRVTVVELSVKHTMHRPRTHVYTHTHAHTGAGWGEIKREGGKKGEGGRQTDREQT